MYHDSSGEHGLIVSDKNLSDSFIWSNYDVTFMADSFISAWYGKIGSNGMISQIGHQYSAALLCDTSTHNGYNDWYLPSIGELYVLCKNQMHVDETLRKLNAHTLNLFQNSSTGKYWSSTEVDRVYAMAQLGSVSSLQHKSITMKVRAIRKF